jgi:hypothetical protein
MTFINIPPIQFAATDTIEVEIVRDTAGQNNGGLETFTPSTGGWNAVPSARITLTRFLISNEVV